LKKIEINDGNTKAVVMKDFGGVISSLVVDGVEILYMNESDLGVANLLAGGIPVLFPFCSTTQDDTYIVNGKEYTMPMHGFVKDMSFSLEKQTNSSVTVYTVPNEIIKKENYPFDFVLHIEYKVSGQSLLINATIDNLSDTPMPYYIGWHTYFRTGSKKNTKFTFDFANYTSYLDGESGEVQGNTIDLSQPLDHVYKGIGDKRMLLENYADGYNAQIVVDDLHEVLTVCTAFADCACIEPWTAVPDAINTGELLRHVAPNSSVTCGWQINVQITK
jgi:galactose mutarotase-like enzyme